MRGLVCADGQVETLTGALESVQKREGEAVAAKAVLEKDLDAALERIAAIQRERDQLSGALEARIAQMAASAAEIETMHREQLRAMR